MVEPHSSFITDVSEQISPPDWSEVVDRGRAIRRGRHRRAALAGVAGVAVLGVTLAGWWIPRDPPVPPVAPVGTGGTASPPDPVEPPEVPLWTEPSAADQRRARDFVARRNLPAGSRVERVGVAVDPNDPAVAAQLWQCLTGCTDLQWAVVVTGDGFDHSTPVVLPEVFEDGVQAMTISAVGDGTFLITYADHDQLPRLIRLDGMGTRLAPQGPARAASPDEQVVAVNRSPSTPMRLLAFDPGMGASHPVPLPDDDTLQQTEFSVGQAGRYAAWGEWNKLWWSRDAGHRWEQSQPEVIDWITPVPAADDGTRWAFQRGGRPDPTDGIDRLWRSRDGGAWTSVQVPGEQVLETVPSGAPALAVRDGQLMMIGSTTPGGPTQLLAIGADGTLTPFGTQPPAGIGTVHAFGADGTIVVSGRAGGSTVWSSTDGTTWHELALP